MDHIIQFLLVYLIIPMFGPWIASTVSNLITTFVSYMPSIVLPKVFLIDLLLGLDFMTKGGGII